ncbi:MAG: hypothetical protein ACJ73D_13835 [Pyrinomonadaceae bacterium]
MSRKLNTLLLIITVAVVAVTFVVTATGKVSANAATPRAMPSPDKSLFSEYRGVKIGMTATDVRAKLGKAKEQTDAQDQFIFNDNESALVYYDGTHAVNAIMITFQGDVKNAPSAKDVFGEDVAPNGEGMVFKMEKYPKAGYWISYTRTSGSDQMVNIALQKM